ncbi:hypothetical protein DDW44_13675 [Streptomyces tirandamycinicus]|uniref:Uncharacterized protein n=1 Tax=Streptomyces tirandamycinicus TaxID=2174846 RepID=A0A2S1STL5_9ACTN|nr:hypothetical protein DDW44_13675 [Streptomyces tirandamycinicus]
MGTLSSRTETGRLPGGPPDGGGGGGSGGSGVSGGGERPGGGGGGGGSPVVTMVPVTAIVGRRGASSGGVGQCGVVDGGFRRPSRPVASGATPHRPAPAGRRRRACWQNGRTGR